MFVTCIGLQIAIEIGCIWDWDLLFLTSPFSVNNLTRTWAGSTCDFTILKKNHKDWTNPRSTETMSIASVYAFCTTDGSNSI